MALKLKSNGGGTGLDITGGQAYIASSEFAVPGYQKAYAFDNSDATIWYANGAVGQYVGVDFGAGVTKKIAKLRFKSARMNAFAVDGSADGSTWATVYTGNRANSADYQTFEFINPTGYRYYRIRCAGALYSGANADVIEAEMMEAVGGYSPAGSAVYGPYDLAAALNHYTSMIEWAATVPAGTALAVKTAVRADGMTPAAEEYLATTSGQAIPNMATGQDLTGVFLWIKVEMTTTDDAVTPELETLGFSISGGAPDDEIQLNLTYDGRMKHPQGLVTVAFTGSLAGPGNAMVAPFTQTFTPVISTPFFNPNDAERIALTVVTTPMLIRVYYEEYQAGAEQIALTVTGAASLIHVNDLDQ